MVVLHDAADLSQPASPSTVTELLDAVRRLEVAYVDSLRVLSSIERRVATAIHAGGRVPSPSSATENSPAPVAHVLRVQLLGTFRAWMDERPIEDWHSARVRTLLKLLVTDDRTRVARDRLIEALWPGVEPRSGVNSLRVAVHALRRMLAEATGVPSCDDMVVYDGNCYTFGASIRIEVDVAAFERLWSRGRQLEAEGELEAAATSFEQAEALYQGDYLSDDPYADWTMLRREALRDSYLALLARLAQRSLATGDHESCIQRGQKILSQDPCREDVYQWLMRCHAAQGQPGRVRRWYDVCVAMLRQELDLAPSSETVALLGSLAARPDLEIIPH
jgi:DNA-binding SARP family transcriptional activator